MANQITINIGAAANDGTGDPLRTAFNDVNLNFANVWNTGLPNSNVQFSDNRILTVNTNANLVLAPNGIGKVASNVDIVPNTANTFSLGGLTRRWNTIYGQYLNLSRDATIAGNLIVTGNISGNGISGGGGVTQSSTAPVDPTSNTLWWDEVSGRLYVWYDDGTTAQWVDAAPAAGSGGGSSGNVFLGNFAFNGNTLYNINGGSFNNSDLTHGATSGVTVAPNGSGTASLFNTYGPVTISAGISSVSRTWTFDGNGNITLPSNTASINYANGSPYGGTGGSSNYGNANVAAFLPTYTGNLSAGNAAITALVASHNIYATTGTFTGDQYSDGAIYVGNPAGTVLGSDVVMQITANAGGYSQTNFQNINSGNSASSDYILTADNGNDTTHFLDMGITSSGWDGSETNVLSGLVANNGYLYVQDGNLSLGVRNGSTSYKWNFDTTGNLTVAGNVIPTGNNTQSLGSLTRQWNDLYLSNATIYMNSIPISLTAGNILTVNGADVVTTAANGVTNLGDLAFSGATMYIADGGSENDLYVTADIEGYAYLRLPTDATANATSTLLTNNGGNVEIWASDYPLGSNTYVWSFHNDSNLAVPGNIIVNDKQAFWAYDADGLTITANILQDVNGFSTRYLEDTAMYANTNVQIISDAANSELTWTFANNGNLVLPYGGIINEGPSPSFTGSAVTITPADGSDPNQQLKIYPTIIEGNHLHLTSGNLQVTDLFLGDDAQYVRTSNTGGMVIGTAGGEVFGGYAWTFDNTGNLTTPEGSGDITMSGGNIANVASIYFYPASVDPVIIGGESQITILADRSNNATNLIGLSTDEIALKSNGEVYINAGSSDWVFQSSGNTLFPILNTTRGDDATHTLTGYTIRIGDGAQEAIITTPNGDANTNSDSQRIVINPGKGADTTNGEGGDIYLWAGRGGNGNGTTGGGSGGDIKIRGGQGMSGNDGGYIRMEGGASNNDTGAAGWIEITGGYTNGGASGYVQITGGYNADGNGGNITLTGGQGSADGGPLILTGGPGIGAGGNVSIQGGSGNDTDGVIVLNSKTFLPVNYTGPGPGEAAWVNGTRTSVGGLDKATSAAYEISSSATPTLCYVASSVDVNSVKLTFAVQTVNNTANWEQFDVAIVNMDGSNVATVVSNRVRANASIDWTAVGANVNAGIMQVYLTLPTGQTLAYVNYQATEFNLMVD